jgi:high-affinity Fe2+/Pb2+ permease
MTNGSPVPSPTGLQYLVFWGVVILVVLIWLFVTEGNGNE